MTLQQVRIHMDATRLVEIALYETELDDST
jgi:hypothetical protein